MCVGVCVRVRVSVNKLTRRGSVNAEVIEQVGEGWGPCVVVRVVM